jgi:hypothetical protein
MRRKPRNYNVTGERKLTPKPCSPSYNVTLYITYKKHPQPGIKYCIIRLFSVFYIFVLKAEVKSNLENPWF